MCAPTFETTKIKTTVAGIERWLIPRKIIAQCDICGDQYLGGDLWNTPAENEQILINDGWLIANSQHVCPRCA